MDESDRHEKTRILTEFGCRSEHDLNWGMDSLAPNLPGLSRPFVTRAVPRWFTVWCPGPPANVVDAGVSSAWRTIA